MSIKFIKGDLMELDTIGTFGHVVNCLTIRSHGLSHQVARKFPWADIYSKRSAVKGRNLAIEKDRGVPGTITCYEEPLFKRYKVLCLLAQWDFGRAGNQYRKIGPYTDSSQNRTKWFKQCLERIGVMGIKSIAFPYKIGCGLGGQNWTLYLGLIKQFAYRYNVEVSIVMK
jgi:O-acetyl-ADP-ribose deacetylase (regulator of RNase III)